MVKSNTEKFVKIREEYDNIRSNRACEQAFSITSYRYKKRHQIYR